MVLPTFASALPIIGDCKGDPPKPGNPAGLGLTAKPAGAAKGDPFDPKSDATLAGTYGTSYKWWNYDNGCKPGSGIMPSMGANLGTLGMSIAGLMPSWVNSMLSAVIDSSWLKPLDKPVAKASNSISRGVWSPWLPVVLTLSAVIILWAAKSGRIAGSVTAASWALLVLVAVTWLVRYPVESVHMMDGGIRTAVTEIATGFSDERNPKASGDQQERANRALNEQMDELVKNTAYATWLKGALGNPDSKTAKKYGPDLLKATQFTWEEQKTYDADPKGAGKKLIKEKGEQFKKIAEQVKKDDPVAYERFTGADWGGRLAAVAVDFIVTFIVCLFLILAAVGILIAYGVARVFVPVAPALGVLFIVDAAREMMLGLLKKVLGPLVMGPVYFLAALVLLAFEAAILASSMNLVLQLVWIGALSWIAWKMLRPAGHYRIPGLRLLTSYLATRQGSRSGTEDALENQQKRAAESTDSETTTAGTGSTGAGSPNRAKTRGDRPVYLGLTQGTDYQQPRAALPAGSSRNADPDEPVPMRSSAGGVDDQPIYVPPQQSEAEGRHRATSSGRGDGVESSTPLALPAGSVDGPPHTVASDEAGSSTTTTTPTYTPGLVGPGDMPDEIHEANMTRDANGEQVFVVYTPESARADRGEH